MGDLAPPCCHHVDVDVDAHVLALAHGHAHVHGHDLALAHGHDLAHVHVHVHVHGLAHALALALALVEQQRVGWRLQWMSDEAEREPLKVCWVLVAPKALKRSRYEKA